MVGYSLGTRNEQDSDIDVLFENNENNITFSKAVNLNLAWMCKNTCSLCKYYRKDPLVVPYSTIKIAKDSRKYGIREIIYQSSDRPESNNQITAILELWGFTSYIEYLFTICELGFLEGVIPVINVGFLVPEELKQLRDVAAIIQVPLHQKDDKVCEDNKIYDTKKRRMKNIEWAIKLGFSTRVSYYINESTSKKELNKYIDYLNKLNQDYPYIQNFILDIDSNMNMFKGSNYKKLLTLFEHMTSNLDPSINVNLSQYNFSKVKDLIEIGLKDLGSIIIQSVNMDNNSNSEEELINLSKDLSE